MKFVCEYNPKKDIAPVDQFGFINLAESICTGIIPGDSQFDSSHYNEMDVDAVNGRPSDVFDALMAGKELAAGAAASVENAPSE